MRLSGTPRWRPVSRSIPGRVRGFLLLLTLLVSPALVGAQDGQRQKAQAVPVALSDSVLSRLPSVYRDEAKSRVAVTNEVQQRLLRLSDEDLTGAVIGQLSRSPDGDEFLLSQLDNESSPKLRGRIIGSLGGYWVSHV